jgi:biotin transporter BioY
MNNEHEDTRRFVNAGYLILFLIKGWGVSLFQEKIWQKRWRLLSLLDLIQ